MQYTIDINTRTLIALVGTILGVTITLTTFLLYRTYKYEIGWSDNHGSWSDRGTDIELPPLFPSQSTNEQDIGEDGGHFLHEERKEVGAIHPILSEEGIQNITAPQSSLSSPEFPLQEPGIPVIIRSDTPTYSPASPTLSEYTIRISDNQGGRFRSYTPPSDVRRAAATARELTAGEELAQLTARNNELERIIACDRTIADFYCRAARPRLSSESSAEYWIRQTTSHAESDAINEADEEIWREHPHQFELIWLERYRQYQAHQIKQGLPGVSLDTRVAIQSEVTWMHSEAGQAWRLADPAEQEDILSHSVDVQATVIFNERYPRFPYEPPAPYRSRFPQKPLPLTFSPRFAKPRGRTMPLYAGSGGADQLEPPTDPPVPKPADEEEEEEAGGSKPRKKGKDKDFLYGLGSLRGDKKPDRFADPYDPDDEPPNPTGAMGDDAPWINCKPDLVRKPLPFKGEADDIDRFITNCEVYFQVHSAYLWLDPYRVAFASSYFEEKAEEWWILELAELRSPTRGKFRYPS
ncbi:hypothetical protein ARMSODRAFT_974494 [Armillaria solidipes]|uniref:Uncharacterized protein n=1 Tax=Armillaria solidipes TaxID=1076256 RepID=A0A2H3C5J7_9AGAR|nr:hypothetical protein ARMSODRAFT_974494 [Armillaria solidipes]